MFFHVHFTLNLSNISFKDECKLKGKKEKENKREDPKKFTWPGLDPLTFQLERRSYINCTGR